VEGAGGGLHEFCGQGVGVDPSDLGVLTCGAARIPAHTYDPDRQVSICGDGGLLTCMANTHTPTVPDGSATNPPPLDEGPKD
jgi:putative ATP-grasp target RiPP